MAPELAGPKAFGRRPLAQDGLRKVSGQHIDRCKDDDGHNKQRKHTKC